MPGETFAGSPDTYPPEPEERIPWRRWRFSWGILYLLFVVGVIIGTLNAHYNFTPRLESLPDFVELAEPRASWSSRRACSRPDQVDHCATAQRPGRPPRRSNP